MDFFRKCEGTEQLQFEQEVILHEKNSDIPDPVLSEASLPFKKTEVSVYADLFPVRTGGY